MYIANPSIGLPAFSESGNAHYEALQQSGRNLGDQQVLVRRNQSAVTSLPPNAIAVLMTTPQRQKGF